MHLKRRILQSLSSAGFPGLSGWTPVRDEERIQYPSTESFLHEHASAYLFLEGSCCLDLGCGDSPRNPFNASIARGLDINASGDGAVICCDLGLGCIPLSTNQFDFITAFDFIEHIQRVAILDGKTRFPFVELMDEIHRILKPGGLFLSRTPAYPHKEAFQDPTHVNIITEDTIPKYFCGDTWAKAYGFKGSFKLIAQEWCQPSLLTLLQKPVCY